MEIVKKNIISIICGVVALAAVAVAFVIVPGKQEELKKNVDGSKSAHDALAGLLSKQRQLPVVNPDNPEQKNLDQFPSDAVIKQGEAITKKVEEESKAILKAAVEMNRHTLLEPDSLPAPPPFKAIAFRNTYMRALPLPTPPPSAGGSLKSVFAQQLNAGAPPTTDELRIASEALAKKISDENLLVGAGGTAANQERVKFQIDEALRKLPIEMRDKVAATARVYINPDTFEINPRIAQAGGAPDSLEIYSAQLSYWIQSDVVAAINDINAGSKSIADSPVKNLIKVRTKPYTMAAPIFVTGLDGAANADAGAALPKVPQAGTTGRVSNGLYDVFHFEVEMDVEADKLPQALRGFGTKRFITPLFVDVKARDNATALAEGHVYGNKPMLRVRGEFEVLYLREWNKAFMPPTLRTKLGIVDTPAAGAEGAQPAAATTDPNAQPADASATPAAGTATPAAGTAAPAGP